MTNDSLPKKRSEAAKKANNTSGPDERSRKASMANWSRKYGRGNPNNPYTKQNVYTPEQLEDLEKAIRERSAKAKGANRQMPHFVQYHNAELQGPSRASARTMGIYTRKRVEEYRGDRVWLISGQGRPRTYALVGSFLISEVSTTIDGLNEAWGRPDVLPGRPIPIDDTDWFYALLRATGNFAFGFQRINDDVVINGLRDVSSNHAKPIAAKLPHQKRSLLRHARRD